jgi:hypothetical protein
MSTDAILQKLDEINMKVNTLLKSRSKNWDPQEWIDKQETMEILKCSERTLQTLRDDNLLGRSNPFGGTKFFYKREEVIALFEKNFKGKI